MKKTKPYITLRDRQWKGKEWFTSWRSQKNIRMLTGKEAESLENIQEVELLKEPVADVVGNDDGRMFCLKCGSKRGFYIFKMHRGKQSNWYRMYKCSDCGEREKKMLY